MNKTAEGDDLLLKLILGRAKTGKTTRMMQMVSQCPAEGMSTRIVIVPEQLSHQTERVLSGICGDSISFASERRPLSPPDRSPIVLNTSSPVN